MIESKVNDSICMGLGNTKSNSIYRIVIHLLAFRTVTANSRRQPSPYYSTLLYSTLARPSTEHKPNPDPELSLLSCFTSAMIMVVSDQPLPSTVTSRKRNRYMGTYLRTVTENLNPVTYSRHNKEAIINAVSAARYLPLKRKSKLYQIKTCSVIAMGNLPCRTALFQQYCNAVSLI